MLNATRYSASAIVKRDDGRTHYLFISVTIVVSECLILLFGFCCLEKICNDVGRVNMLIEKRIFILGAFHLLNALNDISTESFLVTYSFDAVRFFVSIYRLFIIFFLYF